MYKSNKKNVDRLTNKKYMEINNKESTTRVILKKIKNKGFWNSKEHY